MLEESMEIPGGDAGQTAVDQTLTAFVKMLRDEDCLCAL